MLGGGKGTLEGWGRRGGGEWGWGWGEFKEYVLSTGEERERTGDWVFWGGGKGI